MNTIPLRRLIRQYGAAGYLMVGAYLLGQELFRLFRTKRRQAVALLALACFSTTCVLVLFCHFSRYHCYRPALLTDIRVAQSYTVTDLGVVRGYEYSVGQALNNKGQATGFLLDSELEKMHGFVAANGKISDMGTPGGEFSVPVAINDAGQIAGMADHRGETFEGFVWEKGKFTGIGTLKGGTFSAAVGINNKGQAVGFADGADGLPHSIGWQAGKLYDLSASCPGIFNLATGINDNTEIIGIFTDDAVSVKSFVVGNNKSITLPTLGGDMTLATSIGNKGQVVGIGNTEPEGEAIHSFFWQPGGKMTDIGSLGGENTAAYGVNSSGEAVGISETANGMIHAFIWQNGRIQDLNRLIPRGSWELITANGINDQGQIIGTGIVGGRSVHAFVLTPKK